VVFLPKRSKGDAEFISILRFGWLASICIRLHHFEMDNYSYASHWNYLNRRRQKSLGERICGSIFFWTIIVLIGLSWILAGEVRRWSGKLSLRS
jgi:hypothetical protein